MEDSMVSGAAVGTAKDMLSIALIAISIVSIIILLCFFAKKKKFSIFANLITDIILIFRTLIKEFNGSKINIKLVATFLIIQWIVSGILYIFLRKKEDDKSMYISVNVVYSIFLVISLIYVLNNIIIALKLL